MKKFIILCLTIIIFLYSSLPSFAISRFDAYAYWANAQNSIGFIGNDIINYFNYLKSTGMTPPSSIQSEFYKNGYYSNNTALFTQHSGGTASFDLNSLRSVVSWTYNGIDGTTPADVGFDVGTTTTLTLTDECVNIGPYNGFVAKSISYDTNEKIAVYDLRFRTTGISDKTNYTRVGFGFTYNDIPYTICLTVSNSGIGFTSKTDFVDTGFGESVTPTFDVSVFHDYRVTIDGRECSLYVDGILFAQETAQVPNIAIDDGISIGTWKYQTTGLYSVSLKTFDKPETTVIVNLGRSVSIPAGENMEFYIHLKQGSVTNVTQETIEEFDYSSVSQMSLVFDQQVAAVPIEFADDWLYVNIPSSDTDRTFNRCWFTFSTPYVNTNTGDSMRWDMEMAFSDLVFGDPDEIGLNPDVNPDEDKFRDEVIDGIGDINDSLDSIHDVLITPPDLDEFHSYMDSVNGIFDEFGRYVFDVYPNFPPIPEAPAPDFVTRLWLIVDEVLYIGIPLQSRNLGWLTFNSDDNVFRLSHFIVWFTTIFLTRAFIYAISEATKAKNNPIQGDGDD